MWRHVIRDGRSRRAAALARRKGAELLTLARAPLGRAIQWLGVANA